MADTASNEPKKMPKGGRRGGRKFPQYPLRDAVKWADKLVSKTHSGPQSDEFIKAAVVESKSGIGNMRVSALKQFGLMSGSSDAYSATDLAKGIKSAPQGEKPALYEIAALKPDVFKAIYETYHGDSVSIAKLKQRAADLHVHPDAASKCADVYVETMEFAGLLSRDGDLLLHSRNRPEEDSSRDLLNTQIESPSDNSETPAGYDDVRVQGDNAAASATRRGVAAVQVNINLDSSLDTEKLQKQLELLRRYGAL